jgi:outer membrane murein-binding lipoprotein Lpp
MRLAQLALSALLLAGCASALPPAPPAVVCPALVEYDQAIRNRAADEIERLPPGSALAAMIADYAALRAAVRACRETASR